MTYREVMNAIKQGNLKSIYLISGEETYLADQVEQSLIQKILLDKNEDAVNLCNSEIAVDELVNLVESVPFFSEKNIIVVRNTTLFKEKKKSTDNESDKKQKNEEKLIALFENMPAYSILILKTIEKVDKRRKLYKTILKHGCVVEVNAIRPWEVKDWLIEKLKSVGRQLDREAFEYFIEATSVMNTVSLGFLEQEFDKLMLYTEKKIINKCDLIEVLSSIPEVSIFAMLDAISDKNTKKALYLLSEQLSAGDHPLKMITMLSRHTRQLWQVKLLVEKGVPNKQIATQMGMVPFIAEKLAKKSVKFDEAVLKNVMIHLAEADYKLKSSQNDASILECIVIELCG